MKTAWISTLALAFACTALTAAHEDDLKSAAQKLQDAANYSWTTTTERTGRAGGRFAGGPASGVAEKNGYAVLTREMPNGRMLTVIKGDQRVFQAPGGWMSAREMRQEAQAGQGGGSGARDGMVAWMDAGAALPAEELARIVSEARNLEAADGMLTAELPPEAATRMLRGGRAGRDADPAAGPGLLAGTVKFWLTDGEMEKYEVRLQGTVTGRDGRERAIDQTTTTTISSVGSTAVEVPAEAKAKLGG